jgi:hypothetical protein
MMLQRTTFKTEQDLILQEEDYIREMSMLHNSSKYDNHNHISI